MGKLHPARYFAELSGQCVETIYLSIKSGELKSSDLRRPGGRRPRWFISETDWQAFLDARSNVQTNVQTEPVAPAPRTRPAREYV